LRYTVVFFVSFILSSTVSAQVPAVSPRQFLSGDGVISQSMGTQQSPAIAAGGGGYLLAWSDARAVMQGGDFQRESADDIWFQILGPDGVPTQSTPTRIFAGAQRDVRPQVTWNGSAWLLTWLVQPFTASNSYSHVRAVRIDATGTVLDAQPFSLFTGTLLGHSVASDGQNWVVVAQTSSSSLRGVTLSTAAVNPVGPQVVMASGTVQGFSIAWAQGSYLLTRGSIGLTSSLDIFGQRFDAQLAPIDPAPFTVAASGGEDSSPVLCSNGVEYLLAWNAFDFTSFTSFTVAARLSAAGVQQGASLNISVGAAPSDVDWDGSQWFVSTSDGRLARVSAAGQVLDPDGFFVRAPSTAAINVLAAAPATQGGVCAAWSQEVNSQLLTGEPRYEVRASLISSPSSLGVDRLPSLSSPAQGMPSFAVHGAGGALLLRSEGGGEARLKLARLDGQGAQIGSQLTQVAAGVDIHNPSLAWDGTRYLAAWIQKNPSAFFGGDIRVQRVALDGSLIANTVVLGTGAPGTRASVDAVGTGGQFFVIGIRGTDTAVWRLDGASGAVLSGPTVVATGLVSRVSACALPGGGAAVAWGGSGGVGFAFLNSAGAVSSSGSATLAQPLSVAVASSGNEVLIAWDEGGADVRARRFSLAGAPLDAAPFSVAATPTGSELYVDASWDGLRYVCVYQQLDAAGPNSPFESNVRAARISASGQTFDPQGFGIETESISEGQPAIVGVGGGVSWVASSVLRPDAPDASYRIATRVISEVCATPYTYCTAKVNSQFCTPSIAISGAPSASGVGNCVVSASQVLNNTNGILFYGYATAANPFQGGFLCVQAPVRRTPVQSSGGSATGTDCSGAFSFDFNAFSASGVDPLLQVVGQDFACQYWSRDPGDAFGSSLSNAVQGEICQ
jgi:hypothetical protein